MDITAVSKPQTDGWLAMKERNAKKSHVVLCFGTQSWYVCLNDGGKEYTPDTLTIFHPYVHQRETSFPHEESNVISSARGNRY
jgi:hypothetical protein